MAQDPIRKLLKKYDKTGLTFDELVKHTGSSPGAIRNGISEMKKKAELDVTYGFGGKANYRLREK